MPGKEHHYKVTVTWTGNTGSGTSSYRAYERAHMIEAGAKPAILGSSDPAFRGDAARWNPEDLLVASASACHQLWYLHLAATAGIVVTAYEDRAEGVMVETADGGGHFSRITLRPRVTIAKGDPERARAIHHDAHHLCFIANSLKCEIATEPEIVVAPDPRLGA